MMMETFKVVMDAHLSVQLKKATTALGVAISQQIDAGN